jgi:hypothetical protein
MCGIRARELLRDDALVEQFLKARDIASPSDSSANER